MNPRWLRKIATGRAVAIALLVWLSYSAIIFNWGPYPRLKRSIIELPEEDFSATASESQSKLVQLGESGREHYRKFLRLDAANALITTIASTLLLTYALSHLVDSKSPAGLLVYLPIVAGICDLIENTQLAAAVKHYPHASLPALRVASIATRLVLPLGCIVLPVLAFCYAKLGLRAWRVRRRMGEANRS